jgi:glycosyltransferase involved in cell wall biosynthesis
MQNKAASRGMKIVQVITGLAAGGAERVVADLACELRNRGHDLRVVALQPLPPDSPALATLRSAQIPVDSLALGRWAPWRLRRLGRILRRELPDVVHGHLIHANLATRLVSPRRRAWQLVNTVHICERRPLKGWHFLLDRRSIGRCDCQTAVSQAVRVFHAARLGVPPATMPVVANGLHAPARLAPADVAALRQAWGVDDCARVLGSVGRLDRQKGYDRLLALLPALAAALPAGERWGLVLLGDGPERPRLERLARRSPPQLAVRLPGFRADAAACAGAFDLFVMPSRYEGYGLALAEAMAHGVPAVASAVDSLPELLTGYPLGELAEFADRPDTDTVGAAALVARIVRLAQRPERTPRPPRSVADMAGDYEALYTRLLRA